MELVKLGWQMVDSDGWLTFPRQKTSEVATVPVRMLPTWVTRREVCRNLFLASIKEQSLLRITKQTSRAHGVEPLSQIVFAASRDAGLSGVPAHGLRKPRAAAVAQAGGTPSQIGAWLGDVSLGMPGRRTDLRGSSRR